MSYIAAKTQEIVRYCNMITLDWVLTQIIGTDASSWTADSAAWAVGEIHIALVSAGWHDSHYLAANGDSMHCYRRWLGDQPQSPPSLPPASAGNNTTHGLTLCEPCRKNIREWLNNG